MINYIKLFTQIKLFFIFTKANDILQYLQILGIFAKIL